MKLLRAVLAWLGLRLLGRRRERAEREALERRIVEPASPSARAELAVAGLLFAAALCGAGFVVAYALDGGTQLLGLALGIALALVAAALITLSKGVLVTEELEEDYPEPDHEDADAVAQIVREGGDGITRKGLLVAAGGAAGCAMGAAAVVPVASLGPFLDRDERFRTPWRAGVRLVDASGEPVPLRDIVEGAFYTAFPELAPHDQMGSPVLLVRLPPAELRLPSERADWAVEGVLAFSKICTHAGCAVSEYRHPTYEPTQPAPALVCPCHYSTFDPSTGGEVTFGPAGRGLPQLPLAVDEAGHLVAAGDFSGPVGPAFSGIRRRRETG